MQNSTSISPEDQLNKYKFVQLFFSSGIMGNPTPINQQKKLTHVITNILILKGDLARLKDKLAEEGKQSLLKSVRFVSMN